MNEEHCRAACPLQDSQLLIYMKRKMTCLLLAIPFRAPVIETSWAWS
jgi:hypothetical protein